MQLASPFAVHEHRTPITMWELLTWAYKRQMVHYEPVWPDGPQMRSQGFTFASLASLGWFDYTMGRDAWSINAAGTTAHPDAHIVHDKVLRLPPAESDLVMKSAIRGKPPEWDPEIYPLRVVPVRKGGTGQIKMLYKSSRPIVCLIEYEGIPDAEAEALKVAARESYARFRRAVRNLYLGLMTDGSALKRWCVMGIGVDRAPWEE